MKKIKDDLQYFLEQECGLENKIVFNNTKLLSEKLIDSLDLVKLILYLEKNYKIKLDPFDINPENFDSLNKIVCFIKKKRINAKN